MKSLLLVLLALLCLGLTANAQLIANKDLKPDSTTYANVYVKHLHSDENASVFAIWVKKEVKSHKHVFHSEVVTVLEGKGILEVDGKEKKIRKGDIVVIPMNTPHAVVTTSRKPLKVISVQSPIFKGVDRVWLTD